MKKMAKISSPVAIIVVGILVIAVLILAFWSLYELNQLGSAAVSTSASLNPYCIRTGCTEGSQPAAYTLTPEDDPYRYMYQTLDYCVVNAPPCNLIDAINKCDTSTVTVDDINTLGAWYHSNYVPACNYGWNSGITAATVSGANPSASQNPNSQDLKDGPNDDFLVALYACANTVGASSTVISDLAQDCGSACTGSS